jgi:hypothetical protein
MWQHLIQSALLGIEKKPVNPEVFPVEIRNFFNQQSTNSEQAFLETSALIYFYLEAGKCPPKMTREADSQIIEETLETAPSHINEIFGLLDKAQPKLKEKLLTLWLDLLIKKQFIVSPELVIDLLSVGNYYSEITKSKIVRVIGNKGNWIMSLNSGLQYKKASKDESVWTEGNTNERKMLLLKVFRTNPEVAVSMLQSTWEQEPLVNKRAFLDIVKDFRNQAIMVFAENLFEKEFPYNPKEKKTEKECRKILTLILLGYRESSLHQSTMKRLTAYLNIEKKKVLLGLGSKKLTDFQLPDEEDGEFWNAGTIEQTYGFEVKNYDISMFKTANLFWLSYFLEFIPSDAWISNHFDSYQAFLECFLEKEEFKVKISGKVQPVFLNAMMQNASFFSNNQLSLLLLSLIPTNEALPLLKNLMPDEFEQFVKKNKYFADEEILQSGPYNVDESWSSSFSEYILSNVYESLQTNTSNLNAMGMIISQYIHTDAYSTLQKYQEKANGSNFYYQWNASIYEPVNAVLQIRKLIKSNN